MKTRELLTACAALTLVLPSCGGGGGGSNPTPVVTPVAAPTPVPTPTPVALPPGLVCDPTPPPLYGINVKVHVSTGGTRKTLDSRPVVVNMNGFCGAAGFGSGARFCFTRPEGHPEATACDYLAVGRATDTGRWGPTWYYNGKPCNAGAGEDGCQNHPDNQFLVVGRGDGLFEACAAPDIPLSTTPDVIGSRCGRCEMVNGACR